MTPESSAQAIKVAKGLAYVCGHLDELRERLGEDGAGFSAPLGRLLAALREADGAKPDADIAGLLGEVDAAVRQAGDAYGVYGFGGTRRGTSGMEALQVVFRCPLQRCAGRSADQVAGRSQPVCAVSQEQRPLIRERL